MPIVRVSHAIQTLEAGDQLAVEATDPGFEPDLMAWARQLGHQIVDFQRGDVQMATIIKGLKGA